MPATHYWQLDRERGGAKKLQLSIAKTKYITGTQREGDRLKLSLSDACTDTPAQGFIADLSVIQ